MSAYDELYDFIVKRSGISPFKRYEFDGHYLTVENYMRGSASKDNYQYILRNMGQLPVEKAHIFLEKAIPRIIMLTLDDQEQFAPYYKDKIQKIS